MNKIKLIVLTAMIILRGGYGYSQIWLDMNHGVGCIYPREVTDIIVDEATQEIHIRGNFNHTFACETLWNISDWANDHWDSLGCNDGISEGSCIARFQDKIYTTGTKICGSNTIAYLHAWNNEDWQSIVIDSNSSWTGYDMIVENDKLYSSGTFRPIQNEPYAMVFSYDGENITPLISESAFFDNVDFGHALAFYHDTLYVGGKFDSFDNGSRTDNLATIYDSTIHKVGVGLEHANCIVETLCVHRDTLFVGGLFLVDGELGNDQITTLLYYANGELGVYGLHDSNRITCLKSYNDELYIGGWFQQLNGIVCHGVAKLNGHQLTPLNTIQFYTEDGFPSQSNIRDIEILNDTLYIVGGFNLIGETPDYGGVAKLNISLSDVSVIERASEKLVLGLFPNPTDSKLNIKGLPINFSFVVQITDTTGRLVMSEYNKQQIDVAHLSSGIYFIEVSTDQSREVLRFVKK